MLTIRLALCALVLAVAPVVADGGEVRVLLRASSPARSRTVTIADAAELSGGADADRAAIGRLDLAEVPEDQLGITITRRQVEFRIALAGLAPARYRVEGPDVARVALGLRKVHPDEVVAAARQEIQARLGWPAEDVLIELLQPVVAPMPDLEGEAAVSIKAELQPGQRPMGRVQTNVAIWVDGRHRLSLPVYFNVRPYQQVVICRRRVEKGEALDEVNAYLERQPVDMRSQHTLAAKGYQGARARRPLVPGHIVLTSDVETAAPGGGPVVRAQESVKLQVRLGGLRVTAAGLALQEGRPGQLIRVQNVDSKKVVIGRVVEAGLVEVE